MLGAVLLGILAIAPAGQTSAAPVLSHFATQQRAVAITINDGPDGRVTPMILRLLRERGAYATFFVNGEAVRDDPQMLLEIRDAGCEVANHAYHHERLTGRPYREVVSELRRTGDLIAGALPESGRYVRPPYGAVDVNVRRAARQAGLRIVLWNVGDPDETLHNAPINLHPGDIVSLRDDIDGLRQLRMVLDLLDREHLQGTSVGMLLARR